MQDVLIKGLVSSAIKGFKLPTQLELDPDIMLSAATDVMF